MSNRAKRQRERSEYTRGYNQACEDLKTEGPILERYTSASDSWAKGYIQRAYEWAEVRSFRFLAGL